LRHSFPNKNQRDHPITRRAAIGGWIDSPLERLA
jgi:hypothetical protein